MSQSARFRRQLSGSMTWLLAMLAIGVVGCVNLDKKKRTPDFASKAKMTMEDVKKITTQGSKATSIVTKMRESIPGFSKPKPAIAGRVISKDDPTSLDKLPKTLGPDVYLSTARMAEQQGRPDIAKEHYQTILRTTPNNRNALIGLARLHHRAGDTAAAIQIYRDALATHQNDSTILNDLGLCYARSGQLPNAIGALEAAVSLAPNHRMYLNNLATALVEGNRTDEAVAALSRIQSADAANLQVGYLLRKAGLNQQAATYLNQALALNPGLDAARNMLEDSTPRVSSLPSQYSGGIPHSGQPVVTPIQPTVGR